MTEQEIKDRLAELYAKQEAATGWGAAVGARHEETKSLEGQLAALQRPSTDLSSLRQCRYCEKPPGTKIGPPKLARCITSGCKATKLAAETVSEWNARNLVESTCYIERSKVREIVLSMAVPLDLKQNVLRCVDALTISVADDFRHAAQPAVTRDELLRGLAAFFDESIHLTWSNDEIASCLTDMIGAAQPVPVVDKGEAVAWLYEVHVADGRWSQRYTDAKPEANAWQRNIRPLYLAPQPASNAGGELEDLRKANQILYGLLSNRDAEIKRLRGIAYAENDPVATERVRCIAICETWVGTFQDVEIKFTAPREYAIDAINDIVDLIRSGHTPAVSSTQGTTAIDDVPSCGQENDHRRATPPDWKQDQAETSRLAPKRCAPDELSSARIFLREKPSTSYLQRKMQITYNHAARLMEALENEGFISVPDSSGRRTVLLTSTTFKTGAK